MRLDVLLKSLCLVKSRNLARKGCEGGFIKVNGRSAKPSREMKAGDVINISYPEKVVVVEITNIPKGQVSRKDRFEFFKVLREERRDRLFDQ